jgi:uncharacterized protein DUF4402
MNDLWKAASRIPVGAGAFFLSAACVAQTCGGSSSIAIARTADLNFGSLIATASAGTAVIDPATGGRTVTGGVVAAGGAFAPAGFDVLLCGSGGIKRFDVVLPSSAITLTGSGGGTMTVDTFTQNPANHINGSTTVPTPFTVGATLHIAASQTQGTYSGVFSVTVARQ